MSNIEKHSDHDVVAMAQELDSQIRQLASHAHVVLDALRVLVEEARASEIHTTLGFPSWTAYIADALDGQWKLEGDKRAEVVRFLSTQGMSQRAIAKVTGASKTTVHRELEQVVRLDHVVTGMDGKSYPQPEVVHHGAPAEDIARDIELDKELTRRGEDLWQHRWHWTLDESNPGRVSIEEYAQEVGVPESTVRADVKAWAMYLDMTTRPRSIDIPGTVEEMIKQAEQMATEEIILRRRKFGLELAAIRASDESPAIRSAREFGLRLRYLGREAREAIEIHGVTVEQYAEDVGVSAYLLQDCIDSLSYTPEDDEEGDD